MAYLDDTGLAYFWGKIKAYIAMLLASKADDSDVVHKTGDESVSGTKTFNSVLMSTRTEQSSANEVVNSIRMNNSQTTSGKYYQPLALYNSTGRSFFIRTYPSGNTGLITETYFQSLKEVNDTATWGGLLGLGLDSDNVSYVRATSTSSSRTNGTDVLTRDWIPKDTRIVHTTGNETVAGAKTFTGIVYQKLANPGFNISNSSFSKGSAPSSNVYWTLAFYDKNGYNSSNQVGSLYQRLEASTNNQHLILQVINGSSASSTESTAVELYRSSSAKHFYPLTDNAITLGKSGGRWSVVWAATGSISTSDERLKSFIAGLPDSVLDCWDGVSFRQFKFNDSVAGKGADRARLHVGLVAQEIDAAFSGAGLDASAYGLFCHDSWDAEEAVYDGSGNLEKEARPAGDEYSLRYEEALCMEAAYMRRENARLKKRVADLEERLAALELKVS